MEEAIIVILQIFFEAFFNAIICLPFDWFFGWGDVKEGVPGCLMPMVFLMLGTACGWVSLLILPKLLIPLVGLRLINLILSPLLAGGLAAYLASRRERKLTRDQTLLHFFNAFFFTFAFTAVRWAYSR